MASDIWLRTILIVRKETRCRHIGCSFRLTAMVLLYAPSHRQDSTYHGLCYTSRGALAGTRNSSMGPPHEGSIRRPIAPWANALTTELHLAPSTWRRKSVGMFGGVPCTWWRVKGERVRASAQRISAVTWRKGLGGPTFISPVASVILQIPPTRIHIKIFLVPTSVPRLV